MPTKAKSRVACEFCCEQVAAPHLWTFTVPAGTPDGPFKAAIHKFFHDGVKWWGVRVWERQKNQTLHCHAVVCGRHAVRRIRPLFRHYAGQDANVDVKRISSEGGARYIAKYLSKADKSMKGLRRWQCFGKWPVARAKVKGIVHHGAISSAYSGVTTDELALWQPGAIQNQVARNFAQMQIAMAKMMAGAGWLMFLRERRLYAGRELDPFARPLRGVDPVDVDPVTGGEYEEIRF